MLSPVQDEMLCRQFFLRCSSVITFLYRTNFHRVYEEGKRFSDGERSCEIRHASMHRIRKEMENYIVAGFLLSSNCVTDGGVNPKNSLSFMA